MSLSELTIPSILSQEAKRHHTTSSAAQENIARTSSVNILIGRTKLQFSHIYSSMIPCTKFTVHSLSIQGTSHSKFERNPFSLLFVYFAKIIIIHLQYMSYLWLKFGTHIGDPKVNTNTKFEVIWWTFKLEVISNFKCKAKSNFCHAYRANSFKLKISM